MLGIDSVAGILELRSSLLTLGRVDASIALLSLTRSLALGLSRCASLEDMLVAWESVNAVSSRQTVITGMAIEQQDGMEEGADRPHVAKPVEHMERETALAGAAVFIVCYCSISMIFGTICLRDRCSLL